MPLLVLSGDLRAQSHVVSLDTMDDPAVVDVMRRRIATHLGVVAATLDFTPTRAAVLVESLARASRAEVPSGAACHAKHTRFVLDTPRMRAAALSESSAPPRTRRSHRKSVYGRGQSSSRQPSCAKAKADGGGDPYEAV